MRYADRSTPPATTCCGCSTTSSTSRRSSREPSARAQASCRWRTSRRRSRTSFNKVAEQQGLSFVVELAGDLPGTIVTDAGRLRQILKNLLANAFKFTERGDGQLRDRPARAAGRRTAKRSAAATRSSPSSVIDTGHRDPRNAAAHLRGVRSGRRHGGAQYGGTGLGLSISRELVGLLGGEMRSREHARGGQHVHRLPPRDPGGYQSPIAPRASRTPVPARAAGLRAAGAADKQSRRTPSRPTLTGGEESSGRR